MQNVPPMHVTRTRDPGYRASVLKKTSSRSLISHQPGSRVRLFGALAALSAIIALLAFNFAVIEKPASYPWWHQHDCDSDPLYVAQAVTLANDGPLDYIHHPGAVVSSGHACAYRIAAALGGWHPEYLELRDSGDSAEPWDLLEDATRFSRILSFGVFSAFVAVLFGLIYRITRSVMLAFLITFFVATSPVALWHSRVVRPEVPSLLFSLLAIAMTMSIGKWKASRNEPRVVAGSIGVGFLLALAVFSKIQILPAAAVILFVAGLVVVQTDDLGDREDTKRKTYRSLALTGLAALLVPWWALTKPHFLTDEYLDSVGYFDRLVFGFAPESFAPLVAAIIGLLVAASLAAVILVRHRSFPALGGYVARAVSFLSLVAIGSSCAVYAVLAPASRTLSSYLVNTHHLLYAVISNILGNVFRSGFLHHKTIDGNTAGRIVEAHSQGDPILGVNLMWFVAAAAIVTLVHLLSSTRRSWRKHALVLVTFATALAMDIVFTLRWSQQFNYYALFSLVFYGIGFAQFVKLERDSFRSRAGRLHFSTAVALIIVGVLISQVGLRTSEILSAPQATGSSSQSPSPMLASCRGQNPHFWEFFAPPSGER
jgi:hypothetical protein